MQALRRMNNPPLLDVKHLILILDIFKICGILYTRSQGKDLKTRKGFKMTITKRIILSEEEQAWFEKVQDILTSVSNEVETDEEEKTIDKLKSDLDEFCYDYGSDEYRADY